ncbi:MAG TPA: LysR family transcriptional regulator, partial [Myxococcota bacterium]|nr:LysR family transcriptional regulator [Myxococcota bacterium]
ATDLLFAAPRELVADLARPLGLAVADLPLPLPPIPVALHWHERAHRDPGHAWLREQIRATVTRSLADRAPPA